MVSSQARTRPRYLGWASCCHGRTAFTPTAAASTSLDAAATHDFIVSKRGTILTGGFGSTVKSHEGCTFLGKMLSVISLPGTEAELCAFLRRPAREKTWRLT